MRVKSLLLAAAYILIVFAIATALTACEAAREIGRAAYHACKDGLCG